MAEGGEIINFCATHSPHKKNCEYHKEDNQLTPDALQHKDPSAAVGAYLAHGGLNSLLKLGEKPSEEELRLYGDHVAKGDKHLTNHVNALFEDKDIPERDASPARKAIHAWVNSGGIDKDMQDEMQKDPGSDNNYAHGGEVKEDKKGLKFSSSLSETHPEQNLILQGTKANASKYLASLKPQQMNPSLPFDDAMPNPEQEKKYNRAVHVAANPASVLTHIKKGTIEPEHVEHLAQLYPDVHEAMKKKVNEKLLESQFKKEKKPPYHVRQGLSLLMGANLSSEMSPQNIQAAQATFQMKPRQNQGPQGAPAQAPPKKSTASLSKSSQSYLTSDEARVRRQQKA